MNMAYIVAVLPIPPYFSGINRPRKPCFTPASQSSCGKCFSVSHMRVYSRPASFSVKSCSILRHISSSWEKLKSMHPPLTQGDCYLTCPSTQVFFSQRKLLDLRSH